MKGKQTKKRSPHQIPTAPLEQPWLCFIITQVPDKRKKESIGPSAGIKATDGKHAKQLITDTEQNCTSFCL